MQSSLGRNPRRLQTPFERAATIAARCEILLSPGTVISASIRGARFTRNSINQLKKAMLHSVSGFSIGRNCRYGTRKILLVKGSFTSVPGGNPRTSTSPYRRHTGSSRSQVYPGQAFRRDNRPWPVLTARRRWAVVLRVGRLFRYFPVGHWD